MKLINRIITGDSLTVLRTIPDESVNCCVTSPPYFGLRDYGVKGQLGLESTPEAYVHKLVEVFREVHRVLRKDGTLWLNLGDSYASPGKDRTEKQATAKSTLRGGSRNQISILKQQNKITAGLKPKDLIGIPWRVAFALQADGWYLRQDIIWAKPNPTPESVTDRCTKSHEYIFMLAKSKKYYYNNEAIKEPGIYMDTTRDAKPQDRRIVYKDYDGKNHDKQRDHGRRHCGFNDRWDAMTKFEQCGAMRNKRDVWTVSTKSFSEAHFAVFPEDLIFPCILAGCPDDGVVLDPFFGAGTTGVVCKKLNRKYIGIELNPKYVEMAERRIMQVDEPLPFTNILPRRRKKK